MDPVARRSILAISDNPNKGQDYIIDLVDTIHPLRLIIEDICLLSSYVYIPDNLVLVPADYGTYLNGYEDEKIF